VREKIANNVRPDPEIIIKKFRKDMEENAQKFALWEYNYRKMDELKPVVIDISCPVEPFYKAG